MKLSHVFDTGQSVKPPMQRVYQYLKVYDNIEDDVNNFVFDPNVKRSDQADCLKILVKLV